MKIKESPIGSKSGFILKILLILVGVAFWMPMIAYYNEGRPKDGKVQKLISKEEIAKGQVIELKPKTVTKNSGETVTRNYPVIEFKTKDGQIIKFVETQLEFYELDYYTVGKKVAVFYDSHSPDQATIQIYISSNEEYNLTGVFLFLGILGGLLSVIGLVLIIRPFLKYRLKHYLLKNGAVLRATFHQIQVNHSLKKDGKSPYHILAYWKDWRKNKVYIFKSERIWFDPSPYLQKDQEITVLIKKGNLKKNYMDLSFLPLATLTKHR